jgi:hypothetical protein
MIESRTEFRAQCAFAVCRNVKSEDCEARYLSRFQRKYFFFCVAKMSSVVLIVFIALVVTLAAGVVPATASSLRPERDLSAGSSAHDVPFYLTVDAAGKTIAVIYYGEVGDVSKEIKVPCSLANNEGPQFSGPGSAICTCTEKNVCTLEVPYEFVRGSSGSVVDVIYDTAPEDILVVNFRPLKDSNGVTVGAIFDDAEATPILVVPLRAETDANGEVVLVKVDLDGESAPKAKSKDCVVFAFKVVLAACFATACAIALLLCCRKQANAPKSTIVSSNEHEVRKATLSVDDDATETGSAIDDA